MIKNITSQILDKLSISENKIFLFDCLGALLSAFLLGFILPYLETYFGIPKTALYPLAIIAFIFSIYSGVCYLVVKRKWKLFLKIIAISNLIYCIISMATAIRYYGQLTTLGCLFFVIEFIVITTIISIEFKLISYKSSYR